MNYGEWHKVFEIKVKSYDAYVCEHAIKDCHDTLKLHKDIATDNPYYVKLWAEIDALRERQMKLAKTPWKHNAPLNPEFLGAQPARAGEDY